MRLRLCRACQRVVIATTEKLLRTKPKAHRRTCRLVGRSTVSVGRLWRPADANTWRDAAGVAN